MKIFNKCKKNITTIISFLKSATVALLIILTVNACKTVETCEENQVLGNMGGVVNTKLDEHSPSLLVLPQEAKLKFPNTDTNDYLFFTATNHEQNANANETIYNLLLHDIQAGAEVVSDKKFPLNDTTLFRHAGVPVFRYNPETEKLDMFFAALPKFGRLSRDIYFAEKDLETNQWSPPIQLSINTARWESHPTISNDGQILLFASDREGGFGDIDIWASFLNEDGTWGTPQNLGNEINTRGTDYFPMLTEHNDLLFSSNGHSRNRKDFDLFLAKFDAENKTWTQPQMFNFPVNTEFDEAGATIWKNRIFLSSNRRGGCGGKDIYSFQLCGPIVIAGRVKCSANQNQILEGEMFLYDENMNTVGFSEVAADGSFKIDDVEANKNYILDYKNKCYPLKKNVYDFRTPCSDSSTVMIVVDMLLPDKNAELELTEIEIPFFVTGYYKPNTEANLNALRLGFTYNLYGNDRRTRYIAKPDESYNEFVHQVEAGLDDVVRYIANMLAVLDNKCLAKSEKGVLHITVEGWADPRGIAAYAEYLGEDIDDSIFGLRVKKGTRMTNDLLSKLRAYFTSKYFETRLAEEHFNIEELQHLIKWNIEGKGVDFTEDVEDKLKRRVKISLRFLE